MPRRRNPGSGHGMSRHGPGTEAPEGAVGEDWGDTAAEALGDDPAEAAANIAMAIAPIPGSRTALAGRLFSRLGPVRSVATRAADRVSDTVRRGGRSRPQAQQRAESQARQQRRTTRQEQQDWHNRHARTTAPGQGRTTALPQDVAQHLRFHAADMSESAVKRKVGTLQGLLRDLPERMVSQRLTRHAPEGKRLLPTHSAAYDTGPARASMRAALRGSTITIAGLTAIDSISGGRLNLTSFGQERDSATTPHGPGSIATWAGHEASKGIQRMIDVSRPPEERSGVVDSGPSPEELASQIAEALHDEFGVPPEEAAQYASNHLNNELVPLAQDTFGEDFEDFDDVFDTLDSRELEQLATGISESVVNLWQVAEEGPEEGAIPEEVLTGEQPLTVTDDQIPEPHQVGQEADADPSAPGHEPLDDITSLSGFDTAYAYEQLDSAEGQPTPAGDENFRVLVKLPPHAIEARGESVDEAFGIDRPETGPGADMPVVRSHVTESNSPMEVYQYVVQQMDEQELIDLQEDLYSAGFYGEMDPDMVGWGTILPQTREAFMAFLEHAGHFRDEDGDPLRWDVLLEDFAENGLGLDPDSPQQQETFNLQDPSTLTRAITDMFRNEAGRDPTSEEKRTFIKAFHRQQKEHQKVSQQSMAQRRADGGAITTYAPDPMGQAQQFVQDEAAQDVAFQSTAETLTEAEQIITQRR